jgi:hypothetical protein
MNMRAVGAEGYVRVEEDRVVFVRGGRRRLRHPRYHPAMVPFEGITGVSLREPSETACGRLCVDVYGFGGEEIARSDYPFCIDFGPWQLEDMQRITAYIRQSLVKR